MKKRINIEVLYKMIKIKVLTIISILLNKFYTFTALDGTNEKIVHQRKNRIISKEHFTTPFIKIWRCLTSTFI